MARIAIFYGSTTGNTKVAAGLIAGCLEDHDVKVVDIANAELSELARYDHLIFGASTWGYGDLQDDWDNFLPKLKKADLKGKTIALFGLGDGANYPDTFVDGMADLHDVVTGCGGSIIGQVVAEGYNFSASKAIVDGYFVGLALDEDNESNLTRERVSRWIKSLKQFYDQ